MNRAFHVAGLVWGTLSLMALGWRWSAGILGVLCATGVGCLLVFQKASLPLWMRSAAAVLCLCPLCLLIRGQPPGEQAVSGSLTVTGVVTDQALTADRRWCILRLTSQNPAHPQNLRLRIYSGPGVELTAGDVVEYAIRVYPEEQRAQLWASNLDGEAFGESCRTLGSAFDESVRHQYQVPASSVVAARFSRFRQEMARGFLRLLPQGEGAILSAVLLGRTEFLSREIRADFSASGLSHLLAASGLHLSVMVALFGVLLQNRLCSPRLRAILEMAMAGAFSLLTGFPPSMVRASAVLILSRFGRLLLRDSDSLNSLGFSLIVMLLINPYGVFSVSLQLSYLSSIGIAAFSEPMAEWLSKTLLRADYYELLDRYPKRMGWLDGITVCLSAQVLSMPVSCWYFGRISVVALPANLLTALPAVWMLGFGLLTGITGLVPFLGPIQRLFGFASGLCIRFIRLLARGCGSFSWSSFPLTGTEELLWFSATVGVLIFLWGLGAQRRHVFWAVGWSACALVSVLLMHRILWGVPLTISVANYGQSVALVYGKQAAVLGAPENRAESENLVALLTDAGVKELVLFLPEDSHQLNSAATHELLSSYPAARTLPLDAYGDMDGILFGRVKFRRDLCNGPEIRVESGGWTIVKRFDMRPAQAHVLINGRNEIIFAPEAILPENRRYYNATRVFLPAREVGLEDRHEI